MKCRLCLLVGALIAPVLSFADVKYTFDFSFPTLWPQVTMSYTAPSSTAPGPAVFLWAKTRPLPRAFQWADPGAPAEPGGSAKTTAVTAVTASPLKPT
jgi:hypothetical protein